MDGKKLFNALPEDIKILLHEQNLKKNLSRWLLERATGWVSGKRVYRDEFLDWTR